MKIKNEFLPIFTWLKKLLNELGLFLFKGYAEWRLFLQVLINLINLVKEAMSDLFINRTVMVSHNMINTITAVSVHDIKKLSSRLVNTPSRRGTTSFPLNGKHK